MQSCCFANLNLLLFCVLGVAVTVVVAVTVGIDVTVGIAVTVVVACAAYYA